MTETEHIRESRVAIGISLPVLAIGWCVAWFVVPTDTALEAVFRLGMLVGLAGVAIDYGRRLFMPTLRVTRDGFTGNPIWSNRRGATSAKIGRYEVRREMRFTTLRVFDGSGDVIYRIWLQPDAANVAAAVRFLPTGDPD